MRYPSSIGSMLIVMAALALLSMTLMGCPPPEEDLGMEELAPYEEDPVMRTDPVGPLVTLRDGEIDMPSAIPTGNVTFQVVNEGTQEYDFHIQGAGIEEGISSLGSGDEGTLSVDLEPGQYEAWSAVGEDRAQGAATTFTVE